MCLDPGSVDMAGIRNLPLEADEPSLFMEKQTENFSLSFPYTWQPSLAPTLLRPSWLSVLIQTGLQQLVPY